MEDRWTVNIKEAASLNIMTKDFKDLGHAPIDPIRRSLNTAESSN